MVSNADRKKVTAVLLEPSVVEQSELMTSLSAEELSLLETEIVRRLGAESSDRLRKLLATARLITLLKAARDIFSRKGRDQLRRLHEKGTRRRLPVGNRRDESRG